MYAAFQYLAALRRARLDRGDRATIGLAAVFLVASAGSCWSPYALGQADGEDWVNTKPTPQDFYKYRYHPSYARPDQLLRTVERSHLGQGTEKIRTHPNGAYEEFAYILRVFPNHPEGLLGMDEVCRKVRVAGCDMASRIEAAIAVNPNAASTYVIQGIYLSRNGKNAAAIESYKRAIALQPDSPVAHYNLGLAYAETKDYARANEHAQRAYALGFPLSGLREKLKKAGQWKPSEASSAAASSAGAEEASGSASARPEQPSAAAGGEKGSTQ